MLREIRGVDQRDPQRVRRWFQDDYFDLIVWQDRAADIVQFQLCYRRDLPDERVLEWRRGRGFLHMKPEDAQSGDSFLENDTWALTLDGVMPYVTVAERFEAAAGGLPPELRIFIREKITEYARPGLRFRRPNSRTPRWLARLREREARRH